MKNYITHIGMVVLFTLLTAFYFAPSVFHNEVLQQGDIEKADGMCKEMKDYQAKTGIGTTWTGSMFSGMPTYTIYPPAGPADYLNMAAGHLMFLGHSTAGIIFLSMLGMYIFLIAMGYDITISGMGAIAYALSSYFLIIIAAGHVTKGWAMSYMPLVCAGLLLLYRKKWMWGFILFAASLGLEINSNHLQITYYVAIICIFLTLGFIYNSIVSKELKPMIVAGLLALLGAGLAISENADRLYSNYEMSKTSIRGKSRLSQAVDKKADKSDGLDQDYAFAWSYGKGETMTLLIPNFYGGASGGEVDHRDSHLAKALINHGAEVGQHLQTYAYWGDQPFTSGPVYLGSIICFLFVLSLFIVKNKYKWWIVGVTAFGIILSWGKNFGLNDILFHYMPMYNKFRTPSMALVIPQLTFALMACMALKSIMDGEVEDGKLKKALYWAGGITGGLCLIFWIAPGAFLDFSCEADSTYKLPGWYLDALMEDRKYLVSADALRSLVFIFFAFAIILFFGKKEKLPLFKYATAAIGLLVLIDLWGVDQRYLNKDNFSKKTEYVPFSKTKADEAILQDKGLSYRVLTFNDPFNDTHISYYHKSIGGYNAAKLRDYQDLIDMQIQPEMEYISKSFSNIHTEADIDNLFANTPVLNMLNMRYLIYNPDYAPIKNNHALGNAWFIDNVQITENSDDEMTRLGKVDPRHTLLVEKEFADKVQGKQAGQDTSATITLTKYAPNELTYQSNSKSDGIAVFSEIYYQPGWSATIDGKPADHFRADWLLRAMAVPAGKHTIVFKCYPETYWTLRKTASATSILLLVGLIGVICFSLYTTIKKGTQVGKEGNDKQ
jgi:hypothetical protein